MTFEIANCDLKPEWGRYQPTRFKVTNCDLKDRPY